MPTHLVQICRHAVALDVLCKIALWWSTASEGQSVTALMYMAARPNPPLGFPWAACVSTCVPPCNFKCELQLLDPVVA